MTEPLVLVEQAASEEWLSVGQTARSLGVSEDTVRRWLERGKLTGARSVLGRLIDPASVAAVKEGRK